MVGPLNLLSIAFAVLFVGLGVDFGIQLSVRYRSDHFDVRPDAFAGARGATSALPLSLAAMATAAGFLCFLPTDYKDFRVGKIAGAGMLIAFIATITTLPALLDLLNPPGKETRSAMHGWRRSIHFLEKHRFFHHRRDAFDRRSPGCRCFIT